MPDYTHKQWTVHAAAIGKALDEQLTPAVGHIVASLRQRGGLATAIKDGTVVQQAISELGTQGAQLVRKYDARFRGVHEAQARAGGRGEVAEDKWYNLAG